MAFDEFINVSYSYKNLDIYLVRRSIINFINGKLLQFNGELLDIGCGKMPYKKFILKNSGVKKYVGLDIESALEYDKNVKPDFTWNGITMPFEDNQFDCALGTEVLEHCPYPEIVLAEVYRVMKSGGKFFFTVPFLWPLHETPHDEYRYTPFALERILRKTGFENIKLASMGGWHSSMAQMLGLWVRRSPLKNKNRKLLSAVLKPVIWYLIEKDHAPNIKFSESQMITGLCGIAQKP